MLIENSSFMADRKEAQTLERHIHIHYITILFVLLLLLGPHLALCSGITSGSSRGTTWDKGDKRRIGCMQNKHLICCSITWVTFMYFKIPNRTKESHCIDHRTYSTFFISHFFFPQPAMLRDYIPDGLNSGIIFGGDSGIKWGVRNLIQIS